ncbi:unnamed protein product [Auanema sp. JU1783]|nr:unnamed protein product [Auanema sp. JU1783]
MLSTSHYITFVVIQLFLIFHSTSAGSVQVCRDIADCSTCADSYIHVLGFREQCRWCVETNTCGGPLSCPLGKAAVQRDPFRCPQKFSTSKGKRYTDDLGRSVFAVAISVKADNASECLSNVRPDINYVKQYNVECDGAGNSCGGIIAASDEAKALYVAYKGSNFDKQILAEFIHGLAAQLGAWEKFESKDAGVITYFYGAFTKLFIDSGMYDDLMELKKKHPNYRVWLTGHSLGGSLASMTALYLIKHGSFESSKVRLLTFGEPRTGNTAYAREVEKYVPFRYRVVHRNDAISNLPGSADPNTPLMTSSMFDRQPLFYRHLVHYDNKMERGDKFKICELSDDHGCRNLAMAADFQDHFTYFGINHNDFVRDGCIRRQLIFD